MNLVDVLMNADAATITAPQTKEYEVKRLSKALGTKFVLTLQQIPTKRYSEIQGLAVKMDSRGHYNGTDLYTMNLLSLVEGIKDKLATPEMLKKFKAATAKELYAKLFNAGEIQAISNEIGKLCGFSAEDQQEQVDDVKN